MAILHQQLIISALLTFTSSALYAEQQLTTDDGREVLLKDDGQWEYRSTDRFVTSEDGRRIRLKEDGSWSYAGNAPKPTEQQAGTSDIDIKLEKVVIEKYERKAQKNTRVKTQTVFYISLKSSAQPQNKITISDHDISLIEVSDNNGKRYPVLSIQPRTIISSDDGDTLVIRADRSPGLLDDVRSMSIRFKAGILGLQKSVTISKQTIDFEDKNVSGFD